MLLPQLDFNHFCLTAAIFPLRRTSDVPVKQQLTTQKLLLTHKHERMNALAAYNFSLMSQRIIIY